MNELKIFENSEFGSIRVIEIDNEPWFVAADVCVALELDKTQTRRLDDDEKGVYSIQTRGGKQNVAIVSESGLYSLVLGSRKKEAKRFKRWITHDVIPSIRKHGAYMTDDTLEKALLSPDFLIRLANELKTEKERNKQLEEKIERDKPKIVFADAVSVSKRSILIGELAKLLKQNGIEIGQQRLFAWMRDNGYLIKGGSSKNLPTQYSMERGWFEIKETPVIHNEGYTTVSFTPKVTGKGQQYFVNLFLSEKENGDDS